MARTLARQPGVSVHVLTLASRAAVVAAAAVRGDLHRLSSSPISEGLLTWSDAQLPDSLSFHVATYDAAEAEGVAAAPGRQPRLPRLHSQMAEQARRLAQQAARDGAASAWVILDCDESQHSQQRQQQQQQSPPLTSAASAPTPPPPPRSAGAAAAAAVTSPHKGSGSAPIASGSAPAATLPELLAEDFGRRLILHVQNLHHLPFGPCGCAAPTPALQRAWRRAGGCLAVSHWVAAQLLLHGGDAWGAAAPRVHVAQPCAWGCFGDGPFPDAGDAALFAPLRERARPYEGRPPPACHAADAAAAGAPADPADGARGPSERPPATPAAPPLRAAAAPAGGHRQEPCGGAGDNTAPGGPPRPPPPPSPPRPLPAVGMLKLTRDKGACLFASLAQRLARRCRFVAVAAPADAAALRAAGLLPPGLALLPPQGDIGAVLEQVDVVVVPSLLHEAFGMVVVDAMLRGVPVVAADLGALPEAALGAATLAPVVPAALPACAAPDAGRRFERRTYPEQDVAPWEAAVTRLLGSREAYAAASSACRDAALRFAADGPRQVAAFLAWLVGDAQPAAGAPGAGGAPPASGSSSAAAPSAAGRPGVPLAPVAPNLGTE